MPSTQPNTTRFDALAARSFQRRDRVGFMVEITLDEQPVLFALVFDLPSLISEHFSTED